MVVDYSLVNKTSNIEKKEQIIIITYNEVNKI